MTRRHPAVLELQGERVRLRPHRGQDAREAYALLAGRDEILRWLLWEGPSSPEELAEHYRTWCVPGEGGPDLRLAIEELASGRLAGSLSLRFGGHPGQGDLGYWVGLPFQGQGYAQEALELVAHAAFRHLAAHSLYAYVFVGNLPSRRVLERTGFTLVRTIPGRARQGRTRVDEWHFVLLGSEWRRLRGDFRPLSERIAFEEPDPAAGLDSPARATPGG